MAGEQELGQKGRKMMSEERFKVGDKVRMVDGMEGRLLNSWGMMFE